MQTPHALTTAATTAPYVYGTHRPDRHTHTHTHTHTQGTLVDAINRGDFVTPARDGSGYKPNYKVEGGRAACSGGCGSGAALSLGGWAGVCEEGVGSRVVTHTVWKADAPTCTHAHRFCSCFSCSLTHPLFLVLCNTRTQAIYTTLLEVALGLRHLASMAVTHCDVKPANILLRSCPRDPRGFTAKLADFG